MILEKHRLTSLEPKKLSENAISSAWCDDSVKSEIQSKVDGYFKAVKDFI